MRNLQFAFILTALCLSASAFAQKEETILGARGIRLSGIWGGPKAQLTRVGNSNTYINGGQFGLEFGNALLLGVSHYKVDDVIQFETNSTPRNTHLQWSGPMLAYGFNNHKRVHPVVSLEAGPGKFWFNDNTKDQVFVVQPGVGLELNVFRWLHIGVDGGYRFTSKVDVLNNVSDQQLSGAFGQVSLKFGYSWRRFGGGNFWRDGKKKEDKTSKM